MPLYRWNLDKLVLATGAKILSQGKESSFSSISIDSRKIEKNGIFLAIKGENFNGHDFIEPAIKNGASCIICEENRMDKKIIRNESISILSVEDTTKALGDLARHVRKLSKAFFIGVTGSVGKTSTREMIKTILEESFKVLSPEKNFNNHIGVPLTLLKLEDHDYAVIEMGMSSRGEISYLSEIAKPDICIITKIAPAHLAYFSSIEEIAKEKMDIIKGAPKGSTLVINHEDRDLFPDENIDIKTFGEDKKADMSISQILISKDSSKAYFSFLKRKNFHAELSLPGKTNLINAAGAALISELINIKTEDIKKGLSRYKGVKGRFYKYEKNGVTIIDDTYNANPESVKAAIEDFASTKENQRGFIILGDMLELGKDSSVYHEEIGRLAADISPAGVFAYGNFSDFIVKGAADHIDKDTLLFKGTHREIAEELKKELKPGDWVLIKGSRGSKMEKITDLVFRDQE